MKIVVSYRRCRKEYELTRQSSEPRGAKLTSHHGSDDATKQIYRCSNTTESPRSTSKRACGYENGYSNPTLGKFDSQGHDCYLEDCQPRFLCTLRSSISKKPLRDVHCCANSYREDAQSNSKAPPIAIGAFGASELHPLVVNSVGAKQSQHAKKRRAHSPKRVNRHLRTLRNKENKGGEDWMTVGKSQLYKNRQTLPRGVIGGLLLGALLSFLPSVSHHERRKRSCGCSPLCC